MLELICVGHKTREVLPPYGKHRDQMCEAKRILAYLRRNETRVLARVATGAEAIIHLSDSITRTSLDQVEVIGAWNKLCVASVVIHAVRQGLTVVYDPQLVISEDRLTSHRKLAEMLEACSRQNVNLTFHRQGPRYELRSCDVTVETAMAGNLY